MAAPEYLTALATVVNTPATLGTLAVGIDVFDITIHVLTAFDASATITVGFTADTDAYSTGQDVTTTGRKRPTLGVSVGFQSSPIVARAYVTGSPTVGKAIVVMDVKSLQAS